MSRRDSRDAARSILGWLYFALLLLAGVEALAR